MYSFKALLVFGNLFTNALIWPYTPNRRAPSQANFQADTYQDRSSSVFELFKPLIKSSPYPVHPEKHLDFPSISKTDQKIIPMQEAFFNNLKSLYPRFFQDQKGGSKMYILLHELAKKLMSNAYNYETTVAKLRKAAWAHQCSMPSNKNLDKLDAIEKSLRLGQVGAVMDLLDSNNPTISLKAITVLANFYLSENPQSLKDYCQTIGDFTSDPEWQKELHLNSYVKSGARRIFRNKRLKQTIAQTLSDNGEIIETEIIDYRNERAPSFQSYDAKGLLQPYTIQKHSYGVTSIQLSQINCYTCHYKYDSKRFNVLQPSQESLQLQAVLPTAQILRARREKFWDGNELVIIHGSYSRK